MILDTSEGIHGYAPLFAAALCDPRTVATKKMEEEILPVPTLHPKLILTLHFDIGDEAFVANVEVHHPENNLFFFIHLFCSHFVSFLLVTPVKSRS